MRDYLHTVLKPDELLGLSSLALAHVGDAVYDLMVRTWLCSEGRQTAKNLHFETVRRVSAPAQSAAFQRIEGLLNEQERDVFRRGRNAHAHFIPKNASRAAYCRATGLEALLGYLYLLGEYDRINELFDVLMNEG